MAKVKGNESSSLEHFEELARKAIISLRDNEDNGLEKSQQKSLVRLANEDGVITFLASIMKINASDGNDLTKDQLFKDLKDLFDILKYAKDEKHFDAMVNDPGNKKYALEADTQVAIERLKDGEIHDLYLAFHGENSSFGTKIFDFLKKIGHALLPIFEQVAAAMIDIGAKALADSVGNGEVGNVFKAAIKEAGEAISHQLVDEVKEDEVEVVGGILDDGIPV